MLRCKPDESDDSGFLLAATCLVDDGDLADAFGGDFLGAGSSSSSSESLPKISSD